MKKTILALILITSATLLCSCIKTKTDDQEDPAPYRVPIPEAVDLGLSVKWASFNLGAGNPEGAGDYFAWGEIQPKEDYTWATYKWCEGGEKTLTKYNTNSEYGFVDKKKKLDPEDDAAHVLLGGTWRIPTHLELEELMNPDNCTLSSYTRDDGVVFIKITSRIKGFTDNFIVVPLTGYYSEKTIFYNYTKGSKKCFAPLWESDLAVSDDNAVSMKDNPQQAYYGWFEIAGRLSDNPWLKLRDDRRYGLNIRPVCE